MTDTPEIRRLRSHALSGMVPADVAIQAVRDTELRIAAEWQGYRYPVEQIRHEAFREAVEACERAGRTVGSGAEAARMLRSAFLSPDNPEGNA